MPISQTLVSCSDSFGHCLFSFEIDDIKIDDEPPPPASTSSKEVKGITKLNPNLLKMYFKLYLSLQVSKLCAFCAEEKRTERQRLFGDGNDDWKPRTRTTEEILATYKFDGVISNENYFLSCIVISSSYVTMNCRTLLWLLHMQETNF